MKRFFKILSYFLVIIIVLIILLAVIAKLSENKIADIALKKVSENIQAPVQIDNVTFNLLRKFPLATIELNNVLLKEQSFSKDTNSIKSLDTIANIKKIYVSVKSKPLLNGDFEIMKVDIDDALINYHVDTSGITNIDFLLASGDTLETNDTIPSKPINLNLTDLSLKNVVCSFIDSSLKTSAHVSIPELKVKARLEGESISASAKGGIVLSDCSFDKTNLYLMNKTDINFNMDYENDSINIKELLIHTDGAELNLLGNVVLGDAIKTDIQFKGTDLIFDELIKYAPLEIMESVGLQKISGKMDMSATIRGFYSKTEMPQVDLNLSFSDGDIVTKDYPAIKNVAFKGKLTNGILRNNQSTQADFSSFYFETEKSKFDFAFSVLDIDHPKYDIKTNIDVNVGEFKEFIPDSLIKNINGNLKASLSTKGQIPDSIGDKFVDDVMNNSSARIELIQFNVDIDSSLSLKDLSGVFNYKPGVLQVNGITVSVPAYKVYLQNTSFDSDFNGSINKTSDLSVNLTSFRIGINGSEIKGSAFVKNLDHPAYKINTDFNLFLDELKPLIPDTLLTRLSGEFSGNIQSEGVLNLDSVADQAMDILFEQSSFNLEFKNLFAELPDDTLYKVAGFSGKVQMRPNHIAINKMEGEVAGIEFGIDSTKIENLYKSVILNGAEQLAVDTRLSLGDLHYSVFVPFLSSDTTEVEDTSKGQETEKETEPKNYTMLLKGALSVNSFTYDSVFVEDISALFNVSDSVYIIDQLKFKAFNGNMNSSIKYSLKPDNKSVVETKHDINRMDIHKLLTDFNDFEEYYEPSVRAENLSGLFSTELYSRFNMIGDSVISEDIRVSGEIHLEEGGVYDFEPATNLSKYTGIDELDNIKFKTLNSNIFIFKNDIYIPKTYITSSALNITAYGMQSLADDYEYHLEIKLSDILFGKGKKQKRKESKAGDEGFKDDRNMRELFYEEKDGKTKYGFDTDEKQSKMRTKIRVQERLLFLRFKPEMFNFETGVYSKKKNLNIED